MEKLALTAKIMYDKDLLDKKIEIEALKLKSRHYTPKMIFNTLEDWENARSNTYSSIKKTLSDLISPPGGYSGWNQIVYTQPKRLKSEFIYTLCHTIETQLISLTNEKDWSSHTAWDIVMHVEIFFKSFIFSGKESEFGFAFNDRDLIDILYQHIKSQLDYTLFNQSLYFTCGCGKTNILYNHWETLEDGTHRIVCIECSD